MKSDSHTGVAWYGRMFSYLLIIYGAFGLVSGIAIFSTALGESASLGEVSLASLVIGLTSTIANAITLATGLCGRAASQNVAYTVPMRTLAIAGIIASVISLGLTNATSQTLPSALLFNLLLEAIAIIIATNLHKSRN